MSSSVNFDNKKLLDEDREYMASYIDGEYQNEIPGKNDGYIVDKIVCDNGAVATSTPIAAQVGLEILKKLNLILIKKMLKIIIKS